MYSLFANTLEYSVTNFCITIKRYEDIFHLSFMLSYSYPYPIQLVTTGNPVNSYFFSTVDKIHHGPVIAPFSVQLLQVFSYAGGVLATNLF